VERYCTDEQATDDNIIWHMRIECWVTKATDTHPEYVLLVCFSTATVVYAYEPQYFVYTYIASLVFFIDIQFGFTQCLSIRVWRYSSFWALASLRRHAHSSTHLLHPPVPRISDVSLRLTFSHLVLGFPTGLVL